MTTTVETWMTRDPEVIRDVASVTEAAERLVHHRFRHLPVVAADGRLVGLVDDATVFSRGEMVERRFVPHDDRDTHLRVADLAIPVPIEVRPGDPVAPVLRRMVETGRDVAIATGPGRVPVGILTAHDAVRVAPGVLRTGLDTRALATSPPITVHRHQGVGAALDTMRAHHLRHLVVVDGHEPWAVISWRDLVELGAAARRSLPLDGIGWPAVETVPAGSSLYDIAERMVVQKVGCLPVVDPRGHLTGVVTRSDILTLLIAALG